ncbi:MAG: hypothetical protein JO286_11780 [Solirubrobacterales bacterium]|nr:hypothetical protein [Solirubrobacterales bacterium]MBV9807858.1 hypothetical protein [Solirubrobacterales bacterium]
MILPWLLPMAMLVAVLAVALAPNWLIGILGFVALTLLGYVGVPLYWRLRQDPGDGNGESQQPALISSTHSRLPWPTVAIRRLRRVRAQRLRR